MGLLDYMNKSIDCIESKYQRYILLRGQFSDQAIFCFYEGEDDLTYYTSRINALISNKEIVDIECNGRENVLILYNKIDKECTTHKNTLYFIDKDFHINSFQNINIYLTPCYSIENFYILDKAFEHILRYELKINEYSDKEDDKKDFNTLMEYYKKEKEKFIENTKYLNAWYSLQTRKSIGMQRKDMPKLYKLKEIDFSEYPYNNIERLKELTINYIDITNEEIEIEVSRLMKNPDYNFRGKYFIAFLCKILNFIFEESNKPNKLSIKKRRVVTQVSEKNILSSFCQHALTTSCLQNYLNSKLKHLQINNLNVVS
ncbi:DUF4435 domain-containing protein [Clostridium perfringens]|uniref:DUF4435 domain-containing protein n=1 Tax=Clostridium perfringens TaxID=1502 RepID=UPI0030CC6A0E|nr:DUF4435 domain-containing protein [Clostridium perfringens]MDM0588274.1 DUF4435 domain-containing protein [Clostridium perfringens]